MKIAGNYEVSEDGCWLWTGYCDKNGYARAYDSERKSIVWAHRYSYEQHVGPIEPGHQIDHMCQVVNCVNPEHLQQVTRAEHARITMQRLGKDELHLAAARLRRIGATYSDIAEALEYGSRTGAHVAVRAAIEKGLIAADEVPRMEFLTDPEREEIVELVALGVPQGVVAKFYGIHNSQVSRVSRGLRSGHTRRVA